MSAATADRLLRASRQQQLHGLSTDTRGNPTQTADPYLHLSTVERDAARLSTS